MYNKITAILASIFLAVSSCTIITSVEVLQGPSSRTILLGPDGSALDSVASGGTLLTISHGAGLVADGIAVLPIGSQHIVNGPAGSIMTSHTLGGPAVVPAIEPLSTAPVASAMYSVIDKGDYVP